MLTVLDLSPADRRDMVGGFSSTDVRGRYAGEVLCPAVTLLRFRLVWGIGRRLDRGGRETPERLGSLRHAREFVGVVLRCQGLGPSAPWRLLVLRRIGLPGGGQCHERPVDPQQHLRLPPCPEFLGLVSRRRRSRASERSHWGDDVARVIGCDTLPLKAHSAC